MTRDIDLKIGCDDETLVKDLKKAEKDIDDFKAEVESKEKINIGAQAKASDLKAELKTAEENLRSFQNMTSKEQLELLREGGQTQLDLIKEQEAAIKDISKQYADAQKEADKAASALAKAEEKLERAKENAAGLKTQIGAGIKEASMFNKAGEVLDKAVVKFTRRLKTLATRVLFFSVLLKLFRRMKDVFAEVIKHNDEANVAIGRLKGAFNTLAQPLVEAVIPALIAIVNWLTRVLTAITQIIAMLTGKKMKDWQNQAKKNGKGGGKNSSLASFDTINKLSSGGGASEIKEIYDIAELTESELQGILFTISLIAAALMAWKLPFGGDIGFFLKMGGWLATIVGLLIAGKSYIDAWQNGIGWNNLLGFLGGLAIALLGIKVIFGDIGVGIGLVVSAIALLVLGFKDIIENGVNLKNVLTVLTGIFTAGLGIAIITGSWIPLLVAGIAGIAVAIMAVGGTLDEFADGLKLVFEGIVQFLKGAFAGDWKSALDGLVKAFRGFVNMIIALLNGVISAAQKGINWIIDKINSISFTVPDWIPLVGGKSFSPNLRKWGGYSIPYLAEGAVIPPNREFLAVLGDQTSGTNIEAPLETILSAFRTALSEQGTTVEVHFTGDGAAIAEMLEPRVTILSKRRGRDYR